MLSVLLTAFSGRIAILQIRAYVLLGATRKVAILMIILFIVQATAATVISVLTDVRVKGVSFLGVS
jgi:hypothetical protein